MTTTEFPAGTITIKAADEAEALAKYKRLLRTEALKAAQEMEWCNSGTNERLQRLGLRLRGEGVPTKVKVTIERTAYITVDADSKEEAITVINEGGDFFEGDVLTSIGLGKQWKVVGVVADSEPFATRDYAVGDPDDTMSNYSAAAGSSAWCRNTHAGWYCTREPGHSGNHAAGNSTTIAQVWANTSTTTVAS